MSKSPTSELDELTHSIEAVLSKHKGHIVDAVLATAHVYFKAHCLMVMGEVELGHHKGQDVAEIVRTRVHDDVKKFLEFFKGELGKPTTTRTVN